MPETDGGVEGDSMAGKMTIDCLSACLSQSKPTCATAVAGTRRNLRIGTVNKFVIVTNNYFGDRHKFVQVQNARRKI